MRIVLPFVFEQLKQEVLDKSDLSTITSSDCQALAYKISKQTKKQISDTTIKRIYGFALSNSVPSVYTLNLLAEYCGYPSWDNFSDQHAKKSTEVNVKEIKKDTESILDIIRKTTHNTLQVLKNKCVIPFNLTIDRDGINEHLEVFLTGEFRATVLTSPAGYGKTVGLCRWVEAQLNKALINENNDNILFLNSKVLAGLSPGVTLIDWLLALIGLPAYSFRKIFDTERLKRDNFYLIIDEFDGNAFKPEHLELLFNMLLDFLAVTSDWPGIKVILTMRSTAWQDCKKRLDLDDKGEDWFLGFMNNERYDRNVSPFNTHEIKELCLRINPSIRLPEILQPEVLSFFSYPLFFQYYYQKNHTDFLMEELDYFKIYEVISSYIYDKIYVGKYTTEKVLLMRVLLDNGHFKNGKYIIDKIKVYEYLKTYKDAYQDLISIGFLREVNQSKEAQYEEYIEFTNKRLFAATMAAKLLHDCGSYNDVMCLDISNKIVPEYRVYVLKWCIFNAVKTKQYEIFTHLSKIDLSASEKALLLSFLSSLIKRNFLLPPGAKADAIFFSDKQEGIFEYFFGFEFVSFEYEQALKDLLKLDLNEVLKIWINVCLAIIYIIQLNAEEVEASMKTLRAFSDEAFSNFQINPLYCIETIYNYFKFGIVTKKALIQITRFLFNGPNEKTKLNNVGSNNVLYLLVAGTVQIASNQTKSMRLVKKLKQLHAQQETFNPTYNFFLQVVETDALLASGNIEQGLKLYHEVLSEYRNNQVKYTPFMKVHLDFLSASVLKYSGDGEHMKTVIEKMVYSTKKTSHKLIEVNTLSIYLEHEKFEKNTEVNRAAYVKFKKLILSTEFNPQWFLFNYERAGNKIVY
ncbi:NACHT domain-containing protein [Mucilaginibacter agri]|uniref:Uncharacterized protein n=1 Tax=Mucilaginibacter agri TaxID=2695265 RepID=A0A966DU91_9SPHI|nr:ATP-binding protein [Mucilaginibacter agri]NCD72143.1 hypothetical protein [Mucilaginibacter agri]